VDDYVELPDIDLLDNYTLSITYKPTSHESHNALINKYPAYALLEAGTNGEGGVLYAHPNASATCYTGEFVSLNEWHNVTLVFNSGNLIFYADGNHIYECDNMPNSDNNDYNTHIGRDPNSVGEFLNGLVDDAAIWSSALSQSDVQQYISGNTPDTDNLVGHWNFNQGEGNTLTDLSGNGNNGAINGAT
jgi:hypothetical protein